MIHIHKHQTFRIKAKNARLVWIIGNRHFLGEGKKDIKQPLTIAREYVSLRNQHIARCVNVAVKDAVIFIEKIRIQATNNVTKNKDILLDMIFLQVNCDRNADEIKWKYILDGKGEYGLYLSSFKNGKVKSSHPLNIKHLSDFEDIEIKSMGLKIFKDEKGNIKIKKN